MLHIARSKLAVGVVALALSMASIRPLQAQRVPRPTHVTAPWTTGAWADELPEDSGCAWEAEARAGIHWFAGCNNASQWAPSPAPDQLEERPNGWLVVGVAAAVMAASAAAGAEFVVRLYGSEDEHPAWKAAGVGALYGAPLGVLACAYQGGCSWPPFSDDRK
jgi:hypothetical protein